MFINLTQTLAATVHTGTNWTLIIGLTILIALPFISSSIIIPILLAFSKNKKHKHTSANHKKHKSKITKSNHKKK